MKGKAMNEETKEPAENGNHEASESNLLRHARTELVALGMNPDDPIDDMNRAMARGVMDLLKVFREQGHSGSSAFYMIDLFSKLAAFEPLGPLTGDSEEWVEAMDGIFQNKRCSRVFKQADLFDGQAYDVEAIVFREPDGSCFISSGSAQPITFPYRPKTQYVDRPSSGEMP